MAGGRKKKSSSAKKNKSRRSNGADNNTKKPVQVEEVLSQAESAMEMSEVDTALQLFSYAAGVLRSRVHGTAEGNSNIAMGDKIEDNKTLSTVLGKMGELKASNGDMEGARTDFLDAIELLGPGNDKMAENEVGESEIHIAQNSESRAGLHLYLGQLSSGAEALESFRMGVSELERAVGVLERINASDDKMNGMEMEGCEEMGPDNMKRLLVETRRQLCAAHCSIAELYLTDLCEEPDAESLCEASLKSALALEDDESKIGRPLPDSLQTMANFRLSQSRVPEALECILKAYDRMKVGCEAMSALVGLASDGDGKRNVELESKSRELVDVEAASSLPEYNFRCQTAKFLLECASLLEKDNSGANDTINQCAESAIQVCGSLLAENDEVIEVWYLLGCAFMACTPPNPESAHYYWENALSMLNNVKEGMEATIGEDDDDAENELEAIAMQILDIKKKLGKGDGDEEMDDL
mmetsp:Transcript_18227/g.38249  ORF Transcript_18227/g.38249 Transcript_18227/m.38249 type:complete len:469 (+) Transcript_18227:90-1496(+)